MLIKALAAASLLLAATPAYSKWREASTDHFVIYSEESEASLRKFATKLERYEGAMRNLRGLARQNPGPANRLTIYVVDGLGAVQKLSGRKGNSIAGFYIPRASGSIAIVPRRAGNGSKYALDPETVLLHEYAHHFLFQNFPGAYPAWFTEGFAEFHSTAKFEENGNVGLGLPASHRAYGLVSGNPLPIERMMAHGAEKLSQDQREALYGRGWLLTHYLTFEPGRSGQLSKYLTAIGNGRSSIEAAAASFGDLKTLGRELESYMGRRRLSYIEVAATAIDTGPIAIREVTPGEDAVMDAKIRSRRGVNLEQARALLLTMRRLAGPFPTDPSVQATLAEAEYDAGNYAEAEAAADRALAVNATYMDALIYKARTKLRRAEGSSNAADWKEARRWIAAANKADPDDPEPLILFYRSFRQQGIDPTPNAVSGLNYAYGLAPQDLSLRMMVGRQFLADGKAQEARAAFAPIAFNPHGGAMAEAAAAIVAALDKGSAADGLKAWRDPEEEDAGAPDSQPRSRSSKAALRSSP